MNAEQAIDRSISHTEIVTVDHDAETIEYLTIVCDDHVDAGEVHEFWGIVEGRGEWRVHVRAAEVVS